MRRTFLPGLIAVCLLCCAPLSPSSASENPLVGSDDGYFTRSIAADGGLMGLYGNPAALAMQPGEWGLLYKQGLADPGGPADEGVGFTGEWSFALGGKLACGLDQYTAPSGSIRPPTGGEARLLYSRLRRCNVGFAHGVDLGRGDVRLALGAVWRYTDSDAYTLDRLSTWDLGLLLRWRSQLSLAFKARHVDTPELKGLFPEDVRDVDAELTYGAALRSPYRWLTLSADFHQIRRDIVWDKVLNVAAEAIWRDRVTFRFGFDSKNRVNFGFSLSLGHVRGHYDLGRSYKSRTLQAGAATLEWSNRSYGEAIVPGRRVLRLELTGGIPESAIAHDGSRSAPLDTWTILSAISAAADARDVAGILMVLNNPDLTLAQCEEIRDALRDYRERTGREVLFYSERYDLEDYFLATAGSRISLNPLGAVWFSGFRHERPYLGEALRGLGIAPQFLSHGACGATIHQLTGSGPDACVQVADSTYLNTRFLLLKDEIARGRAMESVSFVPIFRQRHFSAEQALERGLIDDIVFADQLPGFLRRAVGQTRVISHEALLGRSVCKLDWGNSPRVALVHIDGVLTREEDADNPLGRCTSAAHLAELMREIRGDNRYRGLILRINSSGGDALASEVIRHELRLTGLEMPVVVSIGHKAVGGGYLAGLAGQRLFADRFSTIGGINALGGKFHLNNAPGEDGVHVFNQPLELVDDALNPWRAYTPEDLRHLDARVNLYYDKFAEAVMETRHIGEAEMAYVGEGRLLHGDAGRHFRMVDEIGGLRRAVAEMRALLDLEEGRDLRIVRLPAARTPAQRFWRRLNPPAEAALGYTPRPAAPNLRVSLMERLRRLDGEQIYFYETLPGEGVELLHYDTGGR